MNAAQAVLPDFLAEQRGTLINNFSLGAFAPASFAVAYASSKLSAVKNG